MKNVLLLSIFVISSAALANDPCFQTASCEEVVSDCRIVGSESDGPENARATAAFMSRTNIQHGCATNAGVQYIWEQGEASSYYTGPNFAKTQTEAKAGAIKACRAEIAEINGSNYACAQHKK